MQDCVMRMCSFQGLSVIEALPGLDGSLRYVCLPETGRSVWIFYGWERAAGDLFSGGDDPLDHFHYSGVPRTYCLCSASLVTMETPAQAFLHVGVKESEVRAASTDEQGRGSTLTRLQFFGFCCV